MYKIDIVQSAEEDIDVISTFYDSLISNGGFDFFFRIEMVIELLEQTPYIYSKYPKTLSFRRAIMDKYPYHIYYMIHEDIKVVSVIAVIHNKRGIEFIKRKLGLN